MPGQAERNPNGLPMLDLTRLALETERWRGTVEAKLGSIESRAEEQHTALIAMGEKLGALVDELRRERRHGEKTINEKIDAISKRTQELEQFRKVMFGVAAGVGFAAAIVGQIFGVKLWAVVKVALSGM